MADEPKTRLEAWRESLRWLWDDQEVAVAELRRPSRLRAFLHFWILVGRNFVRNRCPLRASALAYSSLLAMIPMLALVLSVTTSILKSQGEEPIRKFVNRLVEQVNPYVRAGSVQANGDAGSEALAQAAQAREEAVKKIHEFISRAQTGAIGGTSAIVLLFVAIAMLTRIEDTFNDIWGVARGRSWYMRVVMYWAAITLGPVLLITALGLATAGQLQFAQSNPLHFLTDMPIVKSLISTYLPLVVLTLTFAMIYLLLPNTRVRFSAAFVGGFTAGLLWQTNNSLGVYFVSRFTSNAAVYGGLAMVPVFMIGLYIGWIILLFGAQVAYSFQNRAAYLQERLTENLSQQSRELAAVQLMTQIARRFHEGKQPPSATELVRTCNLPLRLVTQLLTQLTRAQLALEVYDRELRFAPARPIDRLGVFDVLRALREGSKPDNPDGAGPARQLLQQRLARVWGAADDAARPLTFLALIEATAPPAAGPGTAAASAP